ncbi:MAG: LysR family transcriptional regulator [Hyphomicrobiales bacterium]
MQHINWDDFRYFVTLFREGSLSQAANKLGVNATTVSRRVRALEDQLKAQLIAHAGRGQIALTSAGENLLTHAEALERKVDQALSSIKGTDELAAGSVVITATPAIANRLIVPRLNSLLRCYQGLNIEVRPDTRNLSLIRREADIALRLNRPADGGVQVKTRRIGSLHYGIYAAKRFSDKTADELAWVTYRDDLLDLPQAQWISREISRTEGRIAPVKVGDAEGTAEALASAPYRSIIPCLIGDADNRLVRLDESEYAPMLKRELWLMVRSAMADLTRIKVTGDWLEEIFNQP